MVDGALNRWLHRMFVPPFTLGTRAFRALDFELLFSQSGSSEGLHTQQRGSRAPTTTYISGINPLYLCISPPNTNVKPRLRCQRAARLVHTSPHQECNTKIDLLHPRRQKTRFDRKQTCGCDYLPNLPHRPFKGCISEINYAGSKPLKCRSELNRVYRCGRLAMQGPPLRSAPLRSVAFLTKCEVSMSLTDVEWAGACSFCSGKPRDF
ncbi:hypothetical protein CC80DRAFT_188574 [Byssothecium circinans]|uniref:Uncharacterized protein n=1 Tax=Byssothecium circinans TaxID=147558 RepID=A0A6A5TGB4_9PLEO|nr:hypothetical protein CC80DRAFT_188574 [Byssothecium circinans]